MRKLIKVIAVPILCGIVIASSFFVSEFHSEGEDVVAIPRASVVEKTEPVITVLQEESIPIATEEMEGSPCYRYYIESGRFRTFSRYGI